MLGKDHFISLGIYKMMQNTSIVFFRTLRKITFHSIRRHFGQYYQRITGIMFANRNLRINSST